MPVNAGAEYFAAEKRYQEAKTIDERIEALQEMIKEAPTHKGAEKLRAQLRKKLAQLKKEAAKSKKAGAKPRFSIRKEGSAQICIIGQTNSGKSSLLNALTNAKIEVADYEFTTKEPAVGMLDYDGVLIQLVEIPSTFDSEFSSIIYSCDLILILIDGSKDYSAQLDELIEFMNKKFDNKKALVVASKSDLKKIDGALSISSKTGEGLEQLKKEIWDRLGLIRVYTKIPGKPRDKKPITLRPGSTVRNATRNVHKDLLKNFKFARIFNDTKFSGTKVGLDYKLRDLDVVEIHAG